MKLTKYVNHRLRPNAPVFSKTHGIYMFKCDCDMNTYIGETERSLLVRIKEHRPHNTEHRDSHIKSHLTLPCEQYFSKLALLHGPNPNTKQKDEFFISHFSVINVGLTNFYERKYQEAVQISLHDCSLNVQKDSRQLRLFNI